MKIKFLTFVFGIFLGLVIIGQFEMIFQIFTFIILNFIAFFVITVITFFIVDLDNFEKNMDYFWEQLIKIWKVMVK